VTVQDDVDDFIEQVEGIPGALVLCETAVKLGRSQARSIERERRTTRASPTGISKTMRRSFAPMPGSRPRTEQADHPNALDLRHRSGTEQLT
jgi:hypothetical protein